MARMQIPASAVDTGALPDWGQRRTMTDFESVMWRMEVDPRLRSTVAAVDVLDSTPDWDRFLAAHEWATRLLPRSRMRVVETPLHLGNPVWAVDPNFDLRFHVRRLRLPAPATFAQVLEVCQTLAAEPFDPARPPWLAVLVEGPEGGPAAYFIKMHHSLTDGTGGIQLLALLHSRRREATPGKRFAEPPTAEPLGPWGALRDQVDRGLRDGPARLVAAAVRAPAAVAEVVRHPGDLTDTLRYARSLGRVLAPPPCPPSPLLRGRSLSWRFGVLETTVEALKAAGHAAGGSLNDAYIAAVLGGLRRYHEALGTPVDELPMAMPVSLRTADSPMGGNRFAGARFAAPVGIEDPGERISAVREIVLDVRDEPALDALQLFAPVANRMPPALLARAYAAQSTGLDLQASNVPGMPVPVYIAGARILRMFPFGPLPGCAVMTVLVSHVGVCCIGVNVDPAAVTDHQLFMACLHDGLDEVLALCPVPVPADLAAWRETWGEPA